MYTENLKATITDCRKFPAGFIVDLSLSNGKKTQVSCLERPYEIGSEVSVFASHGRYSTYYINR